MNSSTPTFAGWYPDTDAGGTKYWDGYRWTGDIRPQRKVFAAEGAERKKGIWFLAVGALFLIVTITEFDPETGLIAILITTVLIAVGIYMIRGQGPTTKAVRFRLVVEEYDARAKREAANHAAFYTANQAIMTQQLSPQVLSNDSSVGAAQVNAIANQETAKALQNLQGLLFTRTINDEEFKAAKNKLFNTVVVADPYAQIEKLAELHRAGLIGDIEFTSAKARVLGL